jgi:carboxypeptidase C (cathepsin A)
LVHLVGFGPRRIAASREPARRNAHPGAALADNQESWLAFSDLVFVDPVGTGYSRPTKVEYGAEFYQSPGDAESVAEFIRVCRLRLEASDTPLYLAGESYGVTRASLVAEALAKRRTRVAGVILLSGGLPLKSDLSAHAQAALNLPIWTAAAHFHQKLAPDLQQMTIDEAIETSRHFAEIDYAGALARVDALSPQERESVVAQLARLTALPREKIDAKTLHVSIEQVSTSLLGGSSMVGRYDSRLVGPGDTSGGPYDPTKDPSLRNILDGTAVLRYFRDELGYQSDFPYQGPFGGGYPPPKEPRGDWMSVRWTQWKGLALAGAAKEVEKERGAAVGEGKPKESALEGLDAAMARDPGLRVFVAGGYYDLVGECFATDYAASHLTPELASRVTSRVYPGGHATYTDERARRQLFADVIRFYQQGVRQ